MTSTSRPALLHAALCALNVALVSLGSTAAAQTQPAHHPGAVPEPPARLFMPARLARTPAAYGTLREPGSAAAPAPFPTPALAVVTLPPETVAGAVGPQRSHHALSLRSDGARRGLRWIGVDASECALQFRAPSRLARVDGGGATTLDIKAQVRLACRL